MVYNIPGGAVEYTVKVYSFSNDSECKVLGTSSFTCTAEGLNLTFADKPSLRSGGPGNDTISGGLGNDSISGGPGNDTIHARDGHGDVVDCGAGRDVAFVDAVDLVRGCERVVR